jgi:hypothetical protein
MFVPGLHARSPNSTAGGVTAAGGSLIKVMRFEYPNHQGISLSRNDCHLSRIDFRTELGRVGVAWVLEGST